MHKYISIYKTASSQVTHLTAGFSKIAKLGKSYLRLASNSLHISQKGFIKFTKHTLVSYLIVSTLLVGTGLIFLFNPFGGVDQAEAAWFNDNWAFRKTLSFTHNATVSSATKVKFDIDTTAAPDQFQADCGDVRFTSPNGAILPYYYDSAGGACDTSSTDFYVLIPSIINGANYIYIYYGNPSATDGTRSANFSESTTTPSGGAATAGTEEKGPSPVQYWKMDDAQGTSAQDSTTNNLDGTTSTITWQSPDQCVSGSCILNTSLGAIVRPGSDSATDPGTASFSVSAWVKHGPTAPSNSQSFIQRMENPVDVEVAGYILYMNTSGNLCFGIDDDGTHSALDDTACSTTTYLDSQWHHVTAVKSGTTSITIYVDGLQKGQDASLSGTGSLSGGAIFKAIKGLTNFDAWLGFIDEIKVYNSELSAAQILSNYNARSNPEGVSQQQGNNSQNNPGALSNGLLGYWKMDESSGNASDSSVNALTLTNNSSTAYASGKFGNAGSFVAASTDYFSTATTVNGIQTVSFWTNNASTSDEYINLTSGAYITSSSGTVSATGFTSPTIYVNGVLNGTLTASVWNHVVITTNTAVNANALEVGRANSAYNNGKIDDVRVYNRPLTSAEVSQLYNWAAGPLVYLKMDEGTGSTAADQSGNGYNATLVGSPAWSTGMYGKSTTYDGSAGKYAYATNALAVNDFTYSAWVKMTSNAGSRTIFGAESVAASGDNDEFILWSTPNATQTLSVVTNSSTRATSTGTIPLNSWTHVAVTRIGSAISLYINGVLDGTGTDATALTFATGCNLYIGGDPTNGCDESNTLASNFVGSIDEVKVYNYGQSAGQIVENMNAGHPAPGSPVGTPLGYWKFDEGYGTTTNNSGSAGSLLPATLTNMDSPAISTSGWTSSGKFNKALNFNGLSSSGDYLNIPHNAALNITNDITMTAWIKKAADNDYGGIISKTNGSTLWDYDFFICDSDCTNGQDYLALYSDATSPTEVFSSRTITGTDWHHVAVTRIGSTVTFYIDGQPAGSSTLSGSFAASSIPLRIGTDGTGSSVNQFNGAIDEPKLYNQGLTAEQIKLDMNRGQAQVMGALSTSSTSGNDNASTRTAQSAASEYCIPGDSSTCTAPVGRWDMNENTGTTALDSSGNNNTLTFGASTAAPTWSVGKIGGGILYDGSNDSSTAADSTSLDFGSGNFTATFWLYFTTAAGSNNNVLVSKGQNSAPSFDSYQTNNEIRFHVRGTGEAGQAVALSTNNLVTNTWYHVSLVRSGTSHFIYVNGKLDGSGTNNGASIDNANSLYVGGGYLQTLPGKIDQLRLYNYARTAAQIAWDYNKGLPVAHYKMDECQGTTINDSSGNSLTGTLTIGGSGGNTTPGTCATSGAWFDGLTGKRNYSMDFDGTDDYVSVADNSTLDMSADMTISAWAKPSALNSAYSAVAEKALTTGSTADLQYLLGITSSNTWRVVMYTDSDDTEVNSNSKITASTSRWDHIVGIRSGNNMYLYINGQLIGSGTLTGTGNNTTGTFAIGRAGSDSTQYFPGQIDDVRVYNYALTTPQITNLYNQGAINYGPVVGAP